MQIGGSKGSKSMTSLNDNPEWEPSQSINFIRNIKFESLNEGGDRSIGWAQIEKVLLNNPRHIQTGAGGPPEHFEPKHESVASIPVYPISSH